MSIWLMLAPMHSGRKWLKSYHTTGGTTTQKAKIALFWQNLLKSILRFCSWKFFWVLWLMTLLDFLHESFEIFDLKKKSVFESKFTTEIIFTVCTMLSRGTTKHSISCQKQLRWNIPTIYYDIEALPCTVAKKENKTCISFWQSQILVSFAFGGLRCFLFSQWRKNGNLR